METGEYSEGKIKFERFEEKWVEENEYSLEMHLPFIYKVFRDAGKIS